MMCGFEYLACMSEWLEVWSHYSEYEEIGEGMENEKERRRVS
jgi:hypothetical protein